MTNARRDAVRARLPEIGADAMLVTKLVNVRYLTGFSGSAGIVLVGGEDVFFTDSRYEEQSAREVPDARRVIPASGQEKVVSTEVTSQGIGNLAERPLDRLLIEEQELLLRSFSEAHV